MDAVKRVVTPRGAEIWGILRIVTREGSVAVGGRRGCGDE